MEFTLSVPFSVSKTHSFLKLSLHKKWSFPLRTVSVNATKWPLTELRQRPNLYILKTIILYFSVNNKIRTKSGSNCRRTVFIKRFYFFLLKADNFWSFNASSKNEKLKGKFSDNIRKKIWRLFNVLAQLSFTTSEMELDYYYQMFNIQVV